MSNNTNLHPSVIIIGGGIIGCSIAYHLSKANSKVTIIEKRKIGSAASGIAAGMIAPLSEGLPKGPTLAVAQESRSLLLELIPKLQEDSGIDVEYSSPGILHLAYTAEEVDDLNLRLTWQKEFNMNLDWLSGIEAKKIEPSIAEDVLGALLSPNEGNLNSRRLVRSFAQAASNNGAVLMENTEVTGIIFSGNRVTGVNTTAGNMYADWVVMCSGPWSNHYGGWLGIDIPVFPVRGQIMAVRLLPSPITRTVWNGITYMIPKRDGSIVIGTTREHVGYKDKPTLSGISTILTNALKLVPQIADAELHKVWSGLRPYTQDEIPIIGTIPKIEGAILAVGHYRSGILLSAITGSMVSDLVRNGEKEYMLPFNISRFQS